MINLYDFLPDSLGPKSGFDPDHRDQFDERKLSWYSDQKSQKKEKEADELNAHKKDVMRHGSKKVGKAGTPQGKKTYAKWKSDREAAKKKNALRPGEVKKLVNGKWVSNKD